MKPTLITSHKQPTPKPSPPRPSDELFGHICYLLSQFYNAAEELESAKTPKARIAAIAKIEAALVEARKGGIQL